VIHKFDWGFDADIAVLINDAHAAMGEKEWKEAVQVIEFLSIWKDHFQSKFGPLKGTSHLSNPDDPPDALAHFETSTIPIEVCSITPPHVKQSDALHKNEGKNRGRFDIPISKAPRNAAEARDWMYGLAGADIWEPVSDATETVHCSIVEAAERKFGKASIARLQPGLLLLPGDRLFGSLGQEEAIRAALATIRREVPVASEWTIGVHHQWNGQHCFSAIDDPSSGISLKREVKS
jgi:hypothetical protein